MRQTQLVGRLTIRTFVMPGDGVTSRHVTCALQDDDHPEYRATFALLITEAGTTRTVALRTVTVAATGAPALTTSAIRDLPLHRWELAVRNITTLWLDRASEEGYAQGVAIAGGDIDREALVDELMRSLYPAAADDDTPAGVRRYNSLLRLAEVAVEYQLLLAEGRSDPAAEIARMRGVSATTVRGWIFRARKAGFLGPATGPTAGAQAPPGPTQAALLFPVDSGLDAPLRVMRALDDSTLTDAERQRIADEYVRSQLPNPAEAAARRAMDDDHPCPTCEREARQTSDRREVGSEAGSDQEDRVSRR